MTSRTTLAAAACAVAATAAVLSACGDGNDGDDGMIDSTAGQRPSASVPRGPAPTSPARPGHAAAPVFDFPPDARVVIEADMTGDAVKDAVLRDQGYGQRAIRLAIARSDPRLPLLASYVSGTALGDWTAMIRWGRENHMSFTGTVRFYRRQVTVTGPTTAGVAFCEDTTHSYDKDTLTGKADTTDSGRPAFAAHTALMHKSADGTWQMTTYRVEQSARRCTS